MQMYLLFNCLIFVPSVYVEVISEEMDWLLYIIYVYKKYTKHIKFFPPNLAFRFLGIPMCGSQRYSYTGAASNILLYLIVDQDAGSIMFSLNLLF